MIVVDKKYLRCTPGIKFRLWCYNDSGLLCRSNWVDSRDPVFVGVSRTNFRKYSEKRAVREWDLLHDDGYEVCVVSEKEYKKIFVLNCLLKDIIS